MMTAMPAIGWSTLLQILLSWISISYILSLLKRTRLSTKRLPPGPVPLPLIGNLLSLGMRPHASLKELAKAYGPVMSLQLGAMTTVVVSSASAAKLVLQKHDAVFASRIKLDAYTSLGHNDASVVLLPPNAQWRGLRKICTTQVFSNSRLEASRGLRRQKVQELLDYVQDCGKEGKAVNIGRAAFTTSLNFLTNTFFSMDMANLRSDTATELKEVIWGMMEEAGKVNITDLYPMLRHIDPQRIRSRLCVHMERMFKVFDDIIDTRMAARGGEIGAKVEEKDVFDYLLNHAHDPTTDFQLEDIRHLLLDLFAAGTDTTSSTIEWAMTELLRSPAKMEKAQAELHQVIGKSNTVEESDSGRLPYLQAIVKETLRLHPPVPFLVPRRVSEDAELCGFTVPKDAQVLVNVWAMGRDESVWKDVESFEPERFMESSRDYKGQDFEYLPFGAGRRICVGMSLGHRMLHLVLGSLLHSFKWKLEDGVKPEMVNMEDKFGFTLQKTQPLYAVPIAI